MPEPDRPTPLPIARPVVDEAEARAVERVIRSGWLTQGPEVEAFEQEFARTVGAAHAVAVSSGTAALHLALLGLGVGPGDEVVTVSHSFIATANAIRQCGAVPVFVDIEPATFNIDPALVEPALTSRTRAILVVHQMGLPCDLARLVPLARRHGLPLLEDAACAIGSELLWHERWQAIGAPHGDAACFSFHPRKVLTTGDGGMVTTADAGLAARLRRMRVHGMDVPAHVRHASTTPVFERYEAPGFNCRLTDLQAAIGRVQLGRLPGIVRARRALAARYREAFAGHPAIEPPAEPAWARSTWQSYCVRLDPAIDARAVMASLAARGVASRRGVMCAHREPAYRDAPPGTWRAGSTLVHGEDAQDRCLWIPLTPQMTEADQQRVVDALLAACERRPAGRSATGTAR